MGRLRLVNRLDAAAWPALGGSSRSPDQRQRTNGRLIFIIISGVAAALAGLSLTGSGNWWAVILLGVVEAILGFIMLTEPGARPLALAYMFAIWVTLAGTMEIAAAVTVRNYTNGNTFWWLLLDSLRWESASTSRLTPIWGSPPSSTPSGSMRHSRAFSPLCWRFA